MNKSHAWHIPHIIAVMRLLLCCVLGLMFYAPAFAEPLLTAVEQVERPEDELLILEVHVNEEVRNFGIIAYLPRNASVDETLIPLSSLSRAMTFGIKVDTIDGLAQGWFIKEENSFRLDVRNKTVTIKGKTQPLPEGVEVHFEDIFVQARLLEEWFNIEVRPDLSMLRLYVSSKSTLPYEEERLRKERAEGLNTSPQLQDYEFSEDILLPYQWWSKPSVVIQNNLQARRDRSNTQASNSFTFQSYGDALKFGTRFTIAGSADTDHNYDINNATLTFEKRDPANSLLGPLRVGALSFGDVTYPDVPLLQGRKRGRGIAISSESNINISRSFGGETYTIDGDAPIGWDAELYRNGYFVAFQEIPATGRYTFEDIDLVRGFNLFQITLYGPEGQKITQTQRIVRGQEMLQEGQLQYDFAAGQPEADFLPIAENSRTDSTLGASGRVAYGVKNYLTLGSSVFTGSNRAYQDGETLSAVNFTAVTAFKGIKTQAQYMIATENRSGYNFEVTTQVARANITASHTKYAGFDEDDKDQITTTSLDANRNFGKFNASIRAAKRTYQTKENETVLGGTISTNILGMSISNSLERTVSDNKGQQEFEGNLAVLKSYGKWRFRANMDYNLDKTADRRIETVAVSAYQRISRSSTLRLNANHSFNSDLTSAELRYSKEFEKYSIDFNLGGNNDNAYFGGLTFRAGFQADHDGKYQMVSAREGGLGAVGLRAYLDENENGEYDVGEKLLPNITFRSNRGLVKKQTDENGTVFVNGLSEGLTRFQLDDTSLPSIYIKPYDDFVDVIPRTGVTTVMYLGFRQLGEIDGFVTTATADDPNKPLAGVELSLVNVKTGEEVTYTNSEYDGYFVFPAIALGEYEIRALPIWDEAEIAPVSVSVTKEVPIVTDVPILMPAPEALLKSENEAPKIKEKIIAPHILDEAPGATITNGQDIASGEDLRGLFFHLSSLSTRKAAEEERKRLMSVHQNTLQGVTLYIYEIIVKGKTYYRIVGKVKDKPSGKAMCDALIAQDVDGGCRLVTL